MTLKLLSIAIPALALVSYAQDAGQDQNQTGSQSQTETRSSSSRAQSQASTTEKGVSGKHWKGLLVDATCTPSGSMSPTPNQQNNSANRSTSSSSQETSSANRSSTNESGTTEQSTSSSTHKEKHMKMSGMNAQWQSCAATPSTTQFGLVLNDGRMVRLDENGNTQAQGELKNNPKLTANNKPPRVRVRGTLVGDTLQVQSIK